ncbi:MAG: MGMT family protein [Candidatus Omnitrophota bacterium]
MKNSRKKYLINDKIVRKLIRGNKTLSSFAKSVLKATCLIPMGQTRSYKWIAKRIGKPNAARAVGNALNKNPFPLIVPCHRVIKDDGSIGGFSKGVKYKRFLLNIEKDILKTK